MLGDHRWMPPLLVCLMWLLGVAGASAAELDCDSDATGTVVAAIGLVETAAQGDDSNWQPLQAGDTLCEGFTVRTGRDGMVAIRLNRERSMVRLKNSSSVSYGTEANASSWLSLLNGATYIFSRTPVRVDLKMPHVNGGIEGTEFLLQVSDAGDRSFIQVFEGTVSAQTDQPGQKLFAKQGETLTASATTGPRKLSPAQAEDVALWQPLVNPLDQVQWTLHYPFVTNASSDVQDRLLAGDVTGARALLDAAPVTADAVALRLIVQIVQARAESERLTNLGQAERAADVYPRSQAIALALSYAQQSVGDVKTAQTALDRFAAMERTSDLLTLRRAELALINDQVDDAIALGSQAASTPRNLARVNSLLGFAALQELRLKEAEARFQAAVAQDGHDPAARFGLGLTKIRHGEVQAGRQDIEFAASLAPNVSLYRSYLGRAYFEESKTERGHSQLDMAKERDPQDPTPWFFEATQHYVENRPIAALRALNESIERNDNRAVYRSKESLSDDIAVRGSVLSGIYRTLGLEALGVPEAANAIALAPADHAGHRFLADLYAEQSFQDYARASEILQAQLLQPQTLDPVRPQLAETDLTFLGGAGFNGISFNEYTTAFETNGHRLTLAGLGGNFGTAANELLFSGLQGKVAYNISQFHYETDGVRDNNDVRHDIVSAFVQGEINPRLRLQAEFRFRDTEQGDQFQSFATDDFSRTERRNIRSYAGRIGARINANKQNTLIANVGYEDFSTRLTSSAPTLNSDLKRSTDFLILLLQHIYEADKVALVSGIDFVKSDNIFDSTFDTTPSFGGICPGPPSSCLLDIRTPADTRKLSVYSYAHLRPLPTTHVTLGISHEDLNYGEQGFDQFFPKLGINQRVTEGLNLRFAYTESSGNDADTPPTLQPTQIAGFAQSSDIGTRTTSRQLDVAAEFHVGEVLQGQIFAHRRKSVHRLGDPGGTFRLQGNSRMKRIGGLLNIFLNENVSLATSPNYSVVDTNSVLIGPSLPNFPESTNTLELPVTASFFNKRGTSIEVVGTLVKQRITPSVFSTVSDNDESFFTLDMELAHRFLSGRGEVSLSLRNILGSDFRYQDINYLFGDLENPAYISETLVTAGATIRF